MSNCRKSLKKPRIKAFSNQNGCCFYCNGPMWEKDPEKFSSKHRITLKQAKIFRSTGEHLVAHKDGGTSGQKNIVAACWLCNQRRHKRKKYSIRMNIKN